MKDEVNTFKALKHSFHPSAFILHPFFLPLFLLLFAAEPFFVLPEVERAPDLLVAAVAALLVRLATLFVAFVALFATLLAAFVVFRASLRFSSALFLTTRVTFDRPVVEERERPLELPGSVRGLTTVPAMFDIVSTALLATSEA
jgi:hypothetical protein